MRLEDGRQRHDLRLLHAAGDGLDGVLGAARARNRQRRDVNFPENRVELEKGKHLSSEAVENNTNSEISNLLN